MDTGQLSLVFVAGMAMRIGWAMGGGCDEMECTAYPAYSTLSGLLRKKYGGIFVTAPAFAGLSRRDRYEGTRSRWSLPGERDRHSPDFLAAVVMREHALAGRCAVNETGVRLIYLKRFLTNFAD